MDYNISLSYFIDQLGSHPILLVSVLLTLGVIFVNGWTDAPNAIATCVSTRCSGVNKAIIMAAIFNLDVYKRQLLLRGLLRLCLCNHIIDGTHVEER